MTPGPFDRIVLVHGYGADVDSHWFPWLADHAPDAAAVERVALPDPDSPRADAWIHAVTTAIGTLDPGTAVVTHSLGGITAMRAIARLRERRGAGSALGALVLVAPFDRPLPHTGDPGLDAFLDSGLPGFLDGHDPRLVRDGVARATVIRSDDDPLVPAAATDEVAARLRATRVVVPGAGHFLADDGVTRLDAVTAALRA